MDHVIECGFITQKNDYKYIKSKITLPVFDEDSFCDEFWSFANAKTKYIFYKSYNK